MSAAAARCNHARATLLRLLLLLDFLSEPCQLHQWYPCYNLHHLAGLCIHLPMAACLQLCLLVANLGPSRSGIDEGRTETSTGPEPHRPTELDATARLLLDQQAGTGARRSFYSASRTFPSKTPLHHPKLLASTPVRMRGDVKLQQNHWYDPARVPRHSTFLLPADLDGMVNTRIDEAQSARAEGVGMSREMVAQYLPYYPSAEQLYRS